MDRNDVLAIFAIGILIVVGIWVAIPAVGLAVALAKGTATVPLLLREIIVVVAIGEARSE